jgi:glycosyltransferase involved in cell wall biosynthesis
VSGARGGDPLLKSVLRTGYGGALFLQTLAGLPLMGHGHAPRVFYGGARSGNVGGPLVKVQRLRQHFPEHRWTCNLVYCLSNAPYLPDGALALLRLRGIPVVHNQNGLFYRAWYDGDWQAQNARMARTYHQARHVFWQSEFCRRSAEHFLGVRNGPGEVLYNAVDTAHFRPAARAPNARTTLLLTGKIDDHMSYRVESSLRGLADAVAQGLDGALTVAGWIAPAARAKAESLAADLRLGDRVRFTGSYTQAEAPAVYAAADIYVMTKHNDPCPNTVLEAMACGLPVVYSASGGVPELVGEAGAGVAVPEDFERIHAPQARPLADAILRVAGQRETLAAAARARAVARFDMAHWIARHRQVFGELVA